jgi:hypothetical protein
VEARRLRNSPALTMSATAQFHDSRCEGVTTLPDDLGTVFVSYSQDDQDPVKPAYLGHK